MESKLAHLTREAFEAFNRGDWDALGQVFAVDARYYESGTGRELEGQDAILSALQAWRRGIPDLVGRITRMLADSDTTAAEVLWEGTHSGPLEAPGETLQPSGQSLRFYSSFWMRWEGERLAEQRNHVDIFGMLSQMGALPTPSGT